MKWTAAVWRECRIAAVAILKNFHVANPAGAVNGQDERATPAVDSPARFRKWVIKGATAKSAAALYHYSREGAFP